MDSTLAEMLIRLNEEMLSNLTLAVIELRRAEGLEQAFSARLAELVDTDNLNKRDLEEAIEGRYSSLSERLEVCLEEIEKLDINQRELIATKREAIAKLQTIQWMGGVIATLIGIWLSWVSTNL